MFRAVLPLLALACSAAMQPPRAGLPCTGPVSCGRDQLVEADQALQHAVQRRGVRDAFAEALLEDAKLLREEEQDAPPPAWFLPFRGEREPGQAPAHTVASADAAFAALARQTGTQAAFTAQDAVQLSRTMIFGRHAIHRALAASPPLQWSPVVEGASQDLGYTIGAYTLGAARGNYLTTWRLESDGGWRFVVDGGVSG